MFPGPEERGLEYSVFVCVWCVYGVDKCLNLINDGVAILGGWKNG